MHIAAYLRRIDYSGPLEPGLETLRSLHLAHLLTVPFENLDIHWGRPLKLEPAVLYHKVVVQRRGGFCYELNGLFAELLRHLGFTVTLLAAQVHRDDGQIGRPLGHLMLLVQLTENWLVDVAFGDSFRLPLRLVDAVIQIQGDMAFRLDQQGDRWTMMQRHPTESWQPKYTFTLEPHRLSDFEPMCYFNQTSPESIFTQRRLCTRATAKGRITLVDRRLIITEGRDRQEQLLEAGDEAEILDQMFGIQSPGLEV